jgi:SAM-dependent methyltransferase
MSDSGTIGLVGAFHGRLVQKRRVPVLSRSLTALLPAAASLLDVGCGDGTIAKTIEESVPGMSVSGAEFLPRADCAVQCLGFDGVHLPYPDQSFDGCMFVDVLHHSRDALAILRETARVSRDFILIKDHLAETRFDHRTLRFMDWAGNREHAAELPYNYFSSRDWQELYRAAGLREVKVNRNIPLYPAPISWVFGGKLHFIALLREL